LLEKYHLNAISLMKLDIERAAIRAIERALKNWIFPRQLLVEFDEITHPSARAKKNAEYADNRLRQAAYKCRYFDGLSNFPYTLE